MTCKNETCSNKPTGSSAYCSNSCRAIHSRRNKTGAAQQAQHEEVEAHAGKRTLYFLVKGEKVYGRQAVKYKDDTFDTRPEPLNPTDHPHPGGRGKYTRQDGIEYQFDCMGAAHDLTDGLVYATTEDVKACYAEAG